MTKKAILCLFGVINRSIQHTWRNMQTKIIQELNNQNIDVDIYVFNLICDNGFVDGVNVNTTDHEIINATFYEWKYQSELDEEILRYKRSVPWTISYHPCFNEETVHNTMRQMYSEYRVGQFLKSKRDKYDYAIVCGPDYYVTQPVNITDLKRSEIDRAVYISMVNPGRNGFTNGYYMSSNLDNLIVLLCRYLHILSYLKNFQSDYEQLLRIYCITNNVHVQPTNQVFFKIRANKEIHWQGFNNTHKNDKHNINEYENLITNHGLIRHV